MGEPKDVLDSSKLQDQPEVDAEFFGFEHNLTPFTRRLLNRFYDVEEQGFGRENELEEQGFGREKTRICLNFKRASCSSILTQGRCLWGGPSIDFELTTWGLPQIVVFSQLWWTDWNLSSFELFNFLQVGKFHKR